MKIIQAQQRHLDTVVPLFDAYRVYYGQPSDREGARRFLQERMQQNESVIFVAVAGEAEETDGLGFVQLYPSFSSVSMQRLWILNDLFVDSKAWSQGIATELISRARQLVGETGAKGLLLETYTDNLRAQRLYERIGFKRVEDSYYYFLPVAGKE